MFTFPAARSLLLPAKLSSGVPCVNSRRFENRVSLFCGCMQRAEDGRIAEEAAVSKIIEMNDRATDSQAVVDRVPIRVGIVQVEGPEGCAAVHEAGGDIARARDAAVHHGERVTAADRLPVAALEAALLTVTFGRIVPRARRLRSPSPARSRATRSRRATRLRWLTSDAVSAFVPLCGHFGDESVLHGVEDQFRRGLEVHLLRMRTRVQFGQSSSRDLAAGQSRLPCAPDPSSTNTSYSRFDSVSWASRRAPPPSPARSARQAMLCRSLRPPCT